MMLSQEIFGVLTIILLFISGLLFNGAFIIRYLKDRNCSFYSAEIIMICCGYLFEFTALYLAVSYLIYKFNI